MWGSVKDYAKCPVNASLIEAADACKQGNSSRMDNHLTEASLASS
jgi:hypothetical protein